jgi:iron complex transport system substrate-binding protein
VDRFSAEQVPGLARAEVLSSGGTVSLERLSACKPDLVVLWWYQEQLARRLQSLGFRCIRYHPRAPEDVYDLIVRLGHTTRRREAAEKLVADMQGRLARLPREGSPPRVYLELYRPYRTVGPRTFTSEVLRLAGLTNIAADSEIDYPVLSAEELVARDPDLILLAGGGATKSDVAGRPGWSALRAVREGRVFELPPAFLTPGPRFVETVEHIRRLAGGASLPGD